MAGPGNACVCDEQNASNLVPPIQPDTAFFDYYISRVMRKNAPEFDTEDLEALQRVLEEFDSMDIPVTVHEFVTYVGPYTKDQGITMRNVMDEDLLKFEKLQNEVYKPLLDDTADVLMNEDLQRAKKYADEEAEVNAEILNMVSEIYRMVPNFNFKDFFGNPMRYLEEVMPDPETNQMGADSSETEIKIQGLYHRYRWMETELARLNTENNEMEEKLKELKLSLKKQRAKTSKCIDAADQKRQCLLEKEQELKCRLDKTSRKLDEMMIMEESRNREMMTGASWDFAMKLKKRREEEKQANLKLESTTSSEDDDEGCLCAGPTQRTCS